MTSVGKYYGIRFPPSDLVQSFIFDGQLKVDSILKTTAGNFISLLPLSGLLVSKSSIEYVITLQKAGFIHTTLYGHISAYFSGLH